MEHIWLWAQFALASAVIVYSASKLSRYADILSEKLNIGHVFIGIVFLGWITSLPELVLSLGSILYVGEPDLAIGNVLGSCLFNLTILVIADVFIVAGLFFTRTNPRSAVVGVASLIMLLLAAAGLQAGRTVGVPSWPAVPGGLHIDLFSWLIILFYIGSTVFLYRFEKKGGVPVDAAPPPAKYESTKLMSVAIASLVATVAIVGSGLYMAALGDKIAYKYGIAHSFVGTLFFAVVSSLPELSTTIAAARLGFLDMALGNIFGSNIFNIMIISVSDISYLKGSIFSSPQTDTRAHLWVALFAVFATLAVVLAVRRRTSRLFWRLSWVSLVVAACYFAGLFVTRFL